MLDVQWFKSSLDMTTPIKLLCVQLTIAQMCKVSKTIALPLKTFIRIDTNYRVFMLDYNLYWCVRYYARRVKELAVTWGKNLRVEAEIKCRCCWITGIVTDVLDILRIWVIVRKWQPDVAVGLLVGQWGVFMHS